MHLVQRDGGNDRVVAVGGGVAWSPDGRRLVLNRYGRTRSRPKPHWALAIVDLDGRVVRELATGVDHSRLLWSRERGIAYERGQVFVVDQHRGRPRQLTRDRGSGGTSEMFWITGQRRLFYARPRCE